MSVNINVTYEKIKELVDTNLNSNPYEIIFDTTLFNSGKISYTKKVNATTGYGVEEKQVVPAHITEINSRYINIPNVDALEASIGIDFDIFVRDSATLNNLVDQDKYESVSYNNTILSINEFQKDLLATSYQLGDSGLYLGGIDSNGLIEFDTGFKFNTIYLKVDIKNNDNENLIYAVNGTDTIEIFKSSTSIAFSWTTDSLHTISVPYSLGINEIIVYYDASNYWNLVVGEESDSQEDTETQIVYSNVYVSPSTTEVASSEGFDGILYQLLIDNDTITSTDVENGVEDAVSPANINLADFDNRYVFNQNGSYDFTTNELSNSVLWGSAGNITFGFDGLIPVGDMFYNDEGYPRQMFYLNIPCLISNDLLFGNSTEYFLDDKQIYPVDRKTTYGTQLSTDQYILGTTSQSIVEQNGRDLENTFFYKPSRQMNELFKHIVSNSSTQNKVYELVVQYPFYRETYDVIIDSGGSSNNINEFHTFTVTYKNKDDNLS